MPYLKYNAYLVKIIETEKSSQFYFNKIIQYFTFDNF